MEGSSENVRNWLGDRNTAKWHGRMKWPITVILYRDYTQDTAFLQDTGVFLQLGEAHVPTLITSSGLTSPAINMPWHLSGPEESP